MNIIGIAWETGLSPRRDYNIAGQGDGRERMQEASRKPLRQLGRSRGEVAWLAEGLRLYWERTLWQRFWPVRLHPLAMGTEQCVCR